MENLTQKRLIIASLVAAVVVSAATSLAIISILSGEKPTTLVERIVEQGPAPAERMINERILRQDELVVRVVKISSPSVISIVAAKDVPVVEQFFIEDPLFRQFFGESFQVPQFRQKGTQREEVSSGSGFVVSSDGLIITNKHVVADEKAEYTALFNDGSKLPAKVLARDPVQDLAVLKVTPPLAGLVPLVLGDSDKVDIGQSVIAIGNALGEFKNTVSVGVVSGLGRAIVAQSGTGAESLQELIQTDAAINPGNSGGPLLNLRGEVIGINIAVARGAENIGFALLINKAKRDIESVKSTGQIIYPFIGVRYVIVTKELQKKNKLSADHGALVLKDGQGSGVVAASPAAKAGIKEGDIILSMNGERIDTARPLAAQLLKYSVGDAVTLKILRDGKEIEIKVILEERK